MQETHCFGRNVCVPPPPHSYFKNLRLLLLNLIYYAWVHGFHLMFDISFLLFQFKPLSEPQRMNILAVLVRN